MNKIRREATHRIFNILVEHCGVRENIHNRRQFTETNFETCREYRFSGKLGFGGKFYNEYDGWRVDCYKEDRTEPREKIIKTVNILLYHLFRAERVREWIEEAKVFSIEYTFYGNVDTFIVSHPNYPLTRDLPTYRFYLKNEYFTVSVPDMSVSGAIVKGILVDNKEDFLKIITRDGVDPV